MGRIDEKIAVIDHKNRVVGYKLYSELADADTWRIISVWAENDKGQVLMQQRSFQKKLGPGAYGHRL
jgi:isopentenyldiphosphate isomerase